MIDSAQIPDEVVESLIATLYGKPGLPYREAIAAAIAAWPGMTHMEPDLANGIIILPLPPQEASDEATEEYLAMQPAHWSETR